MTPWLESQYQQFEKPKLTYSIFDGGLFTLALASGYSTTARQNFLEHALNVVVPPLLVGAAHYADSCIARKRVLKGYDDERKSVKGLHPNLAQILSETHEYAQKNSYSTLFKKSAVLTAKSTVIFGAGYACGNLVGLLQNLIIE